MGIYLQYFLSWFNFHLECRDRLFTFAKSILCGLLQIELNSSEILVPASSKTLCETKISCVCSIKYGFTGCTKCHKMTTQIKTDDLDQILIDTFTNEFRKGYITVNGFSMPVGYSDLAETIENFEVKDDDIWVCSFPKTGTTA